jgi:glycosyltransferase involved in cell wall biosynthesis
MKILHIITSLELGGAENALYKLCISDRKNTHVVVSFTNGGYYSDLLVENNIELYSLGLNRVDNVFVASYKLYKILSNTKPNIIQTWLYHADVYGGCMSWLFGYKNIVWNIRNTNVSSKALKSTTRLLLKIQAILSFIIPQRIIACSTKSIATHKEIGFCTSKFGVIYNGYDPKTLIFSSDERNRLRSKIGINNSEFVVGMVARFDVQKDHINLLRSLFIIKKRKIHIKCLLIGENVTHNNEVLSKLISEYGLDKQVFLLGASHNIRGIMSSLDLHILSSLGESFPNVVAEAMLCQTPCVATDVGESSRIIGCTGWIVPPQNSKILSDAIIKAKEIFDNDKVKWEHLRILSRSQIIEQFSIKRMVNEYNIIWSQLK